MKPFLRRRWSVRLAVCLGVIIGSAAGAFVAWSVFSSTSAAQANTVAAGVIGTGQQPFGVVSGRDVTVSWGAATNASSYTIARANVSPQSLSTTLVGTCASSVSGLTCEDVGLPESGTLATNWTYTDTPFFNLWQGPTSPPSLTVTIPAPTLVLGSSTFTADGGSTSATVANFFDNEGVTYCVDQFSSCSPGNTLGTETVPASGGAKTTPSISIPAGLSAGLHTVYAIGSLGSLPSEAITITPGTLDHFVLSMAGPQTDGLAFTGTNTLTAKDVGNNTITTFDASANNVAITANSPLTGTVSGLSGGASLTSAADFTSGVANLTTLGIKYTGNTGTGTFTATSGGKTGTSGNVTINVGGPDHFAFVLASPQTDGLAFTGTNTLTAKDVGNNTITTFDASANNVAITANSPLTGTVSGLSGGASLTSAADFTSGVANLTTLGIKYTGNTGTGTFTATSGGKTGTSGNVTINVGGPDHFAFVLASPQTDGLAFTGTNTLTAKDVGNNTITTFDASANNVAITANSPLTGTVSGLSGGASLTSAADFTSGVANLTTLGIKYTGNTGTGTFTATSGGKTGTSGNVTITIGGLDHFLVEAASGGSIGTQTAGTPFNVKITAQDAGDNTVTAYGGTVDVTSNRTCSAGCVQTAPFTLGVLSSTSVTLTQAGTLSTITATDHGGTKTGTSNTFTVSPASPTLSLAGPGSPGAGTAGTAISAASITATLAASSGANATGTITFKYFQQASAPNPCTSGGTTIGTASVTNNGAYNPNVGFTPTVAGNYWLYASYNGDANNNAAASACPPTAAQEIIVSAASPTLSLAGPGSPGAGTAGTAISAASITATLAASSGANATGTITFKYFQQASAPNPCTSGGTTIGTASVTNNGAYNPNVGFTPTVAGNYWLYASYNGDANNNAAASACPPTAAQEIIVSAASPTLSLAGPGSPGAGTAGTAISAASITATLAASSGANATGTITFKYFQQASAPNPCTSGGTTIGTASVTNNGAYNPNVGFTPTVAGNYWLYASYNGDANNNAAASACPPTAAQEIIVAKASPTLSVSAPASGITGTAISAASITATLAASSGANATSTITFTVFGPQASAPTTCTSGGTTVGTATPAGNGTYHPNAGYTPTTAGTYWWYVSSPADSNNNAAPSLCNSASMTSTVVSNPGTQTARQVGNWNDVDTWTAIALSGTISSSAASAAVTGTGTSFLTQVAVGDRILRSDGTTSIGIVQSVTDNTHLTLTVNASNNNTNVSYTSRSIPDTSENVTISGFSVAIPTSYAAVANAVTIGTLAGSALSFAGATSTLTVSSNVSVLAQSTSNGTNTVTVGAGTLTVGGNLSLTGGGGSRNASVTISTGTVNVVGNLSLADNNCTLSFSGAGTFNLSGSMTNSGTFTAGTTSTFNFNGTTAQTIPVASGFANLTVNNTSATGATLSAAMTTANVTGNLQVQSGTLDNGGFAIAGNSGKTFQVAAGATFKLSGTTSTFPTGYSTFNLDNASTVNYAGSGAQSVVATTSYGNLTVSGGNTKTAAAGLTLNGNFTIAVSTTFVASTFSHVVKGNFSNNGTFTAGTSTVTFSGSSAQTIDGSNATTFATLSLSNSSGVSLGGVDTTVGTQLQLDGTILTTGSNKVVVAPTTGTPVTRTTGFVNGNLQRAFASGNSTVVFDVGAGSIYAPISVSVAGANSGGTLIGSTTGAQHPNYATSGLSATKYVNRYWTLTAGTLTVTGYSATFTFDPSDLVGTPNTAALLVKRWNGAAWSSPTSSSSTSTTVTGTTFGTAFGDYASGN